jgi:hypothetical protein
MPFPRAAEMLAAFTHVLVSDDVARDRTEAAGAAQVALQTAEVERLERETPPAPVGPDTLREYLSADGAMVSLVGGSWAEVKSVIIGEVGVGAQRKTRRVGGAYPPSVVLFTAGYGRQLRPAGFGGDASAGGGKRRPGGSGGRRSRVVARVCAI